MSLVTRPFSVAIVFSQSETSGIETMIVSAMINEDSALYSSLYPKKLIETSTTLILQDQISYYTIARLAITLGQPAVEIHSGIRTEKGLILCKQ